MKPTNKEFTAKFIALLTITVLLLSLIPSFVFADHVGGTGHISGKVTDFSTGQPLEGILITILNSSDGSYIYETETDSDGNYSFDGLSDGSYKIVFDDWLGSYILEYYNNTQYFSEADTITISEGQNSYSNINAQLELGSSISGKVTGTNNNPIDLAFIAVYDINGEEQGFTIADFDGTYLVSGLRSGAHYVEFTGDDYYREFYNDKPDLASANPVFVNDLIATTGINAQLASVQAPTPPPPVYTPPPSLPPVFSPAPTPQLPKPAPKITVFNTRMSLKAKPRKIRSGKRTKLVAQLKDSRGRAVRGRLVSIFQKVLRKYKKRVSKKALRKCKKRYKGKKRKQKCKRIKIKKKWIWKRIAVKTTNSKGQVAIKKRLRKSTIFKAGYGGGVKYRKSKSRAVKVTVKKKKKTKKKKKSKRRKR